MPVDQSLVGREFAPTTPRQVTAAHVAAFAAAVGGAPADDIPPTYPIVLAFEAMSDFLAAEKIDLFTASSTASSGSPTSARSASATTSAQP
jgi:hypothetical protein